MTEGGYRYLRRYTTLPSLIYLLTEKKITLLDPKFWDDRNDYSFLARYKRAKNLKSVLALCFTVYENDNRSTDDEDDDEETYHHWSVFAGGSAGVCIKFKGNELIAELEKQDGVSTGQVHYRNIWQQANEDKTPDRLPFVKRSGFRHENEFRVIYGSKNEKRRTLDIPISLSTIELIRLSPWLPKALCGHVERTLRAINGCENLAISRSTLINSEKWMRLGRAALDPNTGEYAVIHRAPRGNKKATDEDGSPPDGF